MNIRIERIANAFTATCSSSDWHEIDKVWAFFSCDELIDWLKGQEILVVEGKREDF